MTYLNSITGCYIPSSASSFEYLKSFTQPIKRPRGMTVREYELYINKLLRDGLITVETYDEGYRRVFDENRSDFTFMGQSIKITNMGEYLKKRNTKIVNQYKLSIK